MCNFSHLHVHTDASRIDGLGTVDSLVSTAKSLGFKHLAMTDHGTLANAISFDNTCRYNGIKPIMGLEGYVKEEGNIYHITLLADGANGFDNLVTLNNIATTNRLDGERKAFTVNDLLKHNAGIYLLSGCPSSPLQELEWSDAKRIALRLKDIYQERFFSELMFVVEHIPSWERSVKLAKELNLQLVVTNDVHYAEKDQAAIHRVLTKLKGGFEYDDTHLYLATANEMVDRLDQFGLNEYKSYLLDGMENAYILADKLGSVQLEDKPKLPHIDNADNELNHKIFQGLASTGKNSKQHLERANYEFRTIQDMQFSSYFLILKDIIDYARNHNIRVGVRGSGVASLVLYLLGITDIDPLEYDLSFERFLNPKRLEMPDVDVDIDYTQRDKVIEYASKKWDGLPVATYGRYNEKSLVRELLKFFGFEKDVQDKCADEGVDGKTWKDIVKENAIIQQCYDTMLGQIKYVGKHPGGFIITDKNVPYELDTNQNLMVAWTEGEHKELAQAGIVKFDLLGLKAHSILSILEKKHGKAPEPTENHEVFELFHTGNTTGIFQFSGSQGIVEYTKRVKPNKLEDLIAINALYRPGALGAGTAQMYPEWKEKPRKLHPLIDDILENTYGIVCYQEQFMQLYARVTDGDLADADFARKIIVKNKTEQLPELQDNFVNGCLNHGISLELANQIWGEIASHSRYSFNKAHSTAYSKLAWEMAYFKYYYPVDYYAALLTIHPEMGEDYLFAAALENVNVVMPDVNNSSDGFESDGNKIYMPLSSVYGLSTAGTQAIIENRPYTSLSDFMDKVPKRQVNKRARKGLYALGAFDDICDKTNDKENVKVLGIDEIEEKTQEKIQLTYLGFTIPTVDLIRNIQKYANMSNTLAGVVSKKSKGKSKYNGKPFTRFFLKPSGFAWARGSYEGIDEGDKVVLTLNSYNQIIGVNELC